MKLNILYEDSNLLVIDKPAGIAVHPGHSKYNDPTIADLIKGMVDDPDPERPGIVHRLDKNTSGVMLIAKTPESKAYLQAQFKARTVQKEYTALVKGHLKHSKALIDWPIARHPKNPMKRAVRAGGRPSQTEYRVEKEFPKVTLLKAWPKTGRTHQLRVHLAFMGHPIIGDNIYGQKDNHLNRHFLHASSITFKDIKGADVIVSSPLPKELEDYLVYN